jgi:Heterokaryon incompatibility protein (HET)
MEKLAHTPVETLKDEICLLRIFPRHPQPSSTTGLLPLLRGMEDYIFSSLSTPQISCRLEKASLTDHPQYLALSYTFDDPIVSQRVLINGMNVPITEDVSAALRYLQHETQVVTIWIDALCTNQSDEKENAEQMAEKTRLIYQEAAHVLVWLGKPWENSDELIDCLARIGKACEDLELRGITPQIFHELSKTPDNPYTRDVTAKLEQLYEKFDYLFPDIFPFEAHRAFFGRQWWHCFGKTQELEATKGATFICGEKSISWDHLGNAQNFLLGYCLFMLATRDFLEEEFEVKLRWVVDYST